MILRLIFQKKSSVNFFNSIVSIDSIVRVFKIQCGYFTTCPIKKI